MISDIYLLIAIKQTYSQTLFQYSKSFHLEAENKYKSTHFKLRTKVSELSKVRTNQEMQVHSLGQEDPLEEGMATHSSILAWRVP